jgi:hypothetical protein
MTRNAASGKSDAYDGGVHAIAARWLTTNGDDATRLVGVEHSGTPASSPPAGAPSPVKSSGGDETGLGPL